GAHLAAMLSSVPDRTYEPIDAADRFSAKPNYALLIYPAYLYDDAAPEARRLARELKVSAQMPPTFLVQNQDDVEHVPSSMVYFQALMDARVSAEMHIYPSGGHGYGLRPTPHLVGTWPQRAEDWLRSRGLIEPSKGR